MTKKTTSIKSGETPKTVTLVEAEVMTITGSEGARGMAYLLDQALGGTNSLRSWIIESGSTEPIGPFETAQKVQVSCASGSIEVMTQSAVLKLAATAPVVVEASPSFDVLENAIAPTTYAAAVASLGDQLTVGGWPHRKVYCGNVDETLFAYVPDRTLVIPVTGVDLSGGRVNNGNPNEVKLGSIKIPGDALRWASSAVLSITVTANSPMVAGQISFAPGRMRTDDKYRTKKAWTVTQAGNSITMEVSLAAQHCSVLKLDQVQEATAPTSYPSSSRQVEMNLLANAELPIIFKFNAIAFPSSCFLTGIDAKIMIAPPKRFQLSAAAQYRKPYIHPFTPDDIFNSPVLNNVVAPGLVYTHDWATTAGANNTAGTINAQGTAGSPVVTLARTAGLKPGMYPMMGGCQATYAATDAAANFTSVSPNTPTSTLEVFGAGNKILSVDSPTQITMEQPLVSNLLQRGKESYGMIRSVVFYPNAETVHMHYGQRDRSTEFGQLTGIKKTSLKAPAYPNEFPIVRAAATDPVRLCRTAQVVAPNGWLFTYTDAEGAGGENLTNTSWKMRIPAYVDHNYIAALHNSDRNFCCIDESGKFSIEFFYTTVNATTGEFYCSRAVVTDLMGRSIPYILDRPEFLAFNNTYDGISYGTRAWGGGLIGGIVRGHELANVPDSSITGESDALIAANIAKAMAAIPHGLAMVLPGSLLRSPNYCPDPAVQSNVVMFKSYISQFEKHTPGIAAAGSGYAVGEVLYAVGGLSLVPLRCVVTAVGANGSVAAILVTAVGQYKTLPDDGSSIATTSSGAGSGCALRVVNLPGDPSITSLSQAFPESAKNSSWVYPATVCDRDWKANYSGSIPLGAFFTLPGYMDLVAEWTYKRKYQATMKSSSYEYLAVLAAVQRYGAVVVDLTRDTHNVVVVDHVVRNSPQFANLHGDVGGFNYPNLQDMKTRMVYIENMTIKRKGVGATPRGGASFAAPLYPINN